MLKTAIKAILEIRKSFPDDFDLAEWHDCSVQFRHRYGNDEIMFGNLGWVRIPSLTFVNLLHRPDRIAFHIFDHEDEEISAYLFHDFGKMLFLIPLNQLETLYQQFFATGELAEELATLQHEIERLTDRKSQIIQLQDKRFIGAVTNSDTKFL